MGQQGAAGARLIDCWWKIVIDELALRVRQLM